MELAISLLESFKASCLTYYPATLISYYLFKHLKSQVAESPKLAKKLVTELERLPNGSFVAAPQTEVSVESTSPRTKRVVKPKENADEKFLENTLTPGIEL